MLEKRSKGMKVRSSFFFIILFAFCLGVFVSGCNDNSSVSVPITKKAIALKKKVKKKLSESLTSEPERQMKKTPPPVKTAKLNIQDKSELKRVSYKSNITELRDPFIPFIKFTEKTAKQKVKKPLLPLQRYTLSQLTLVAIIDAGKRGRWAMVQDATGKGFTVKRGMPIGNEGGIVKEILPDQLIVSQIKVDLLGKKKEKLIALKLHPERKGE